MRTNSNTISAKEFKTRFPFLAKYENYLINRRNELGGCKTLRGYLSRMEKRENALREKMTAPEAKEIVITIEWHKNVWGYCPRAEARIWLTDGTFISKSAYAGGWGYDKHSTVIAEIFNGCCISNLYNKRRSIKKAPYGIRKDDLCYEGGVGVNCYKCIANFLGFKCEHNGGKTFDYWRFSK